MGRTEDMVKNYKKKKTHFRNTNYRLRSESKIKHINENNDFEWLKFFFVIQTFNVFTRTTDTIYFVAKNKFPTYRFNKKKTFTAWS